MRLRCNLREHRARRRIRDIANDSGVAQPYISQIEAGRRVPTDLEIAALEPVYGLPFNQWYPELAVRVLELDEERAA